MSALDFQRRFDLHLHDVLARKNAKINKAKKALRAIAATLTKERKQTARAIEILDVWRESYKGKEATHEHYQAILMYLRVKSALGYETE
jgi:predicted Zn-dependent protease